MKTRSTNCQKHKIIVQIKSKPRLNYDDRLGLFMDILDNILVKQSFYCLSCSDSAHIPSCKTRGCGHENGNGGGKKKDFHRKSMKRGSLKIH